MDLPSDIEEVGEGSQVDSDGARCESINDSDSIAPGEETYTSVGLPSDTTSDIAQETPTNPHIRLNDLEEQVQIENEVSERTQSNEEAGDTHMAKIPTNDYAAPTDEAVEGNNVSSTIVKDVPMALESEDTTNKVEKGNESRSSAPIVILASVDTLACSGDSGETRRMEEERRKILKDWVALAAAILKQKVSGKEWNEIVDTWVDLQRRWEEVEVRLIPKSK